MSEQQRPGIFKCLWNQKVKFYKNNLARSRQEAKAAEEELERTLKQVKTVRFIIRFAGTTLSTILYFFHIEYFIF